MRAFLAATLAGVLLATSIPAKSQMLDRTRPPAPGPEPETTFPPFSERTLTNGLHLLVVENHKLPLVTISVVVRGGASLDGRLPGLADFTAALLMKGTAGRSATEIADQIEFLGASMHAGAGWDATTVSLSSLTRHLDIVLDILADVVLRPTFPEDEVGRQRALQLADLKQMKADANYLAGSRAGQMLYRGHPYGNLATDVSISAITREDCLKYHDTWFVPNNGYVVVAGDVTADSIARKLETLFVGWNPHPVALPKPPGVIPVDATRVFLVDRPQAVQSSLRVIHEGVARNNADFLALDALNTMLGGYFNSRLNASLREKHGFTYGITSRFDGRAAGGSFVVACDVRNAVTDSAVKAIIVELQRIVNEPVPDSELTMMKNYVAGKFPLTIETPQQVASQLHSIELYGLPADYYATLGTTVRALTAAQLHELAKKYIHPDRLMIVAAGNTAEIRERMAAFGTVDIVDADGKPVVH
jgi:zinc protease